MLKLLKQVATAVTDHLHTGRQALSDEIERRKSDLVEQAAAEARAEIKAQGGAFLSRTTRQMAKKAALRLGFLGTLLALRLADILPLQMFAIAAGAGLAVFFLVDLVRVLPTLKLVFRHLRLNQWNPLRAGREAVAATVFENVIARAADVPVGTKERLALRAVGTDPEEFAKEVANAVADIARETSWQDIQPYAVLAAINITTFWIFYVAATWLIFHAR